MADAPAEPSDDPPPAEPTAKKPRRTSTPTQWQLREVKGRHAWVHQATHSVWGLHNTRRQRQAEDDELRKALRMSGGDGGDPDPKIEVLATEPAASSCKLIVPRPPRPAKAPPEIKKRPAATRRPKTLPPPPTVDAANGHPNPLPPPPTPSVPRRLACRSRGDDLHHIATLVEQGLPSEGVYADDALRIVLLDGTQHPECCDHLCRLGKLLIPSKRSLDGPTSFWFFVVATVPHGQLVGYFSRPGAGPEESEINAACVAVLPQWQHKGYGYVLVQASYEVSRLQGQCGRPEEPLSAAGWAVYWKYWRLAILSALVDHPEADVAALSAHTHIAKAKVVYVLHSLGLLRYNEGAPVVLPEAVSRARTLLQHLTMPSLVLDPTKFRLGARITTGDPQTSV